MKNNIRLFISGCLALVLTSCLGDDESYDYSVYKNCQIASFSLSYDNVSELAETKFIIDQLNGKIFNTDSLPYGTVLDKGLTCTVEYMSEAAVAYTKVRQQAIGDTIYWNGSDTLNFSKPVIFEVVAYDGVTSKTYTAQVNIHQVIPDTLVWEIQTNRINGLRMEDQKVIDIEYNGNKAYFMYTKLFDETSPLRLFYSPASNVQNWQEISMSGLPANGTTIHQMTKFDGYYYVPNSSGKLYSSANGLNWSEVSNTPNVKYLLGSTREEGINDPILAAVVDNGGVLTFASMDKASNWELGEEIPDNFPVKGFGTTPYYTMYHEYLMIVGGRDKNNRIQNNSWSTIDGKTWIRLTKEGANYFTRREGVILTRYDDKLFLIGGLSADGTAVKDIYTSIDHGMTWSLLKANVVLPDNFMARGYSSIIVDEENYIYLFSGKTGVDANQLNDIWRGRINRLGFK